MTLALLTLGLPALILAAFAFDCWRTSRRLDRALKTLNTDKK